MTIPPCLLAKVLFFSPAEDEPATTWHGGNMARHPTIVRQAPAQRARSREGLLNEFANATPDEEHSAAILEKPEPQKQSSNSTTTYTDFRRVDVSYG